MICPNLLLIVIDCYCQNQNFRVLDCKTPGRWPCRQSAMYDKGKPLLDDPCLLQVRTGLTLFSKSLACYLQEACIDYICDNIESICNPITAEDGEKRLQFKEEEVRLFVTLTSSTENSNVAKLTQLLLQPGDRPHPCLTPLLLPGILPHRALRATAGPAV